MNTTTPSSAAVALLAGQPAWVAFEGEVCSCDSYPTTDKVTGTHDHAPSWATEALEPVDTIDDFVEHGDKRVLTFEAECPTCGGTGQYVDDRGEQYEDTCPEDDCTAGTVTVSAHVVKCLPILSMGDKAPTVPYVRHYEGATTVFDGALMTDTTLHGDPKAGMFAVLLEVSS